MSLNLLVTASNTDIVGNNINELPWEPVVELLNQLLDLTAASTIVMGRKTFESLGSQPIAGRNNVVLTRQNLKVPRGCKNLRFVSSLQEVVALAKKQDVWVIGGGSVLSDLLGVADSLTINRIYGEYEGNIKLPRIPRRLHLDTLSDPETSITGVRWHTEVYANV